MNMDMYQEPQGPSKRELLAKLERLHMRRNAVRSDLEDLDDDIRDAEEELEDMEEMA